MAAFCPKSAKGVALRATLLDSCGIPITTVNSQIGTAGFITLEFTPDIEAGTKITKRAASGAICVRDISDCDKLLGYNVKMTLCDINPIIMELLLGATLLNNAAGDTVGFVEPPTNFNTTAFGGTSCSNRVQLEVWSENVATVACNPATPNPCRYLRWIFPKVFKWQHTSAVTFKYDDTIEYELSGYAESNINFASTQTTDPDLLAAHITAIRAGGPVAQICSSTLPTIVACGYSR